MKYKRTYRPGPRTLSELFDRTQPGGTILLPLFGPFCGLIFGSYDGLTQGLIVGFLTTWVLLSVALLGGYCEGSRPDPFDASFIADLPWRKPWAIGFFVFTLPWIPFWLASYLRFRHARRAGYIKTA